MTTSVEAGLRNAEIVQQALLPKRRHFDKLFSDSFVLYHPKEMLSGDFYWIGRKGNKRFIVVGDCSGNGISAALITVLMLNLLEYIVMNKGIIAPDAVLNELDKRYIESFSVANDTQFDNPWVDLSILCIDDTLKTITYASANRKLLHVQSSDTFEVYKSNGYSLGGWQVKNDRNFNAQSFSFQPGDKIYMGSDGFQDQFGGKKQKKFGSKQLHTLLSHNSDKPFDVQKERLSKTLRSWRANEPQTDDICIVGVKL